MLPNIVDNMTVVLQMDGKVAYTVVCPVWPVENEQQREGKEPIDISPLLNKLKNPWLMAKKQKHIQKFVSITTGDQCLPVLYLVWVRDMNMRQDDRKLKQKRKLASGLSK